MMKRIWAVIGCAIAILGFVALARAETSASSPVGRWKTIDDSTKQPKSIVWIWERDGTVYGTITGLFPAPGEPAEPLCDKCDGNLKNKPILGMTIMWGFKPDGSEWSGGRILDPENGKVYRCFIEVQDGGRRLKVRGYVGISILGRTQYWIRVP